jgi:periplasmic protein TonB
MRAWVPAVLAAVVLHLGILLFGGVFFLGRTDRAAKTQVEDVDLLTVESEEKEPETEAVETDAAAAPVAQEAPPQMVEPESAPSLDPGTPRLDALSLGELAAALDAAAGGAGGADGFGGSASLASGGAIGGTGEPGSGLAASPADAIFDIGELDQRPRAVLQVAPTYPRELRQRKVEGTVYVVFVVDIDGHVLDPKVEEATDEAFRGPAIDAVRRWRFEPATLRGEKVRSKVRVPIRFSLS